MSASSRVVLFDSHGLGRERRTPFANGPPSRDQPCAKVDHPFSCMEEVYCGKIFPRVAIEPGQCVIQEDPRRAGLFRLFLSRNCGFINNFLPATKLFQLCNMDIQAVLTLCGALEYMTKYMTKTSGGSLLKVMEESFTKCVDRAKSLEQGSGSAVLRFFNLSSVSDVKSQQETMHLCFKVPRSFSSREFRRLALRPMVLKMRKEVSADGEDVGKQSLVLRSKLERYAVRHDLQVPQDLTEMHPVFHISLEEYVLKRGGQRTLAEAWPIFLQRLSFYELGRLFNFSGSSLRFKPKPDILVLSPKPRIKTYGTEDAWLQEVRMALIAYCNWGSGCSSFASLASLDDMPDEDVIRLMRSFVDGGGDFCRCPRFVADAWTVGLQRREKKRGRGEAMHATTVQAVMFLVWNQRSWIDSARGCD